MLQYAREPCLCAIRMMPAVRWWNHRAFPERQAVALAEKLKALGDPTRVRMLDLLAQQREPLCVCDITPRFAQNQPTISHHLRVLREVGLIDTEKRGIWAYYWATETGKRTLVALAALDVTAPFFGLSEGPQ